MPERPVEELRALRGNNRVISPDQVRPDGRPVMASPEGEHRILGLTERFNFQLSQLGQASFGKPHRYRNPKDY